MPTEETAIATAGEQRITLVELEKIVADVERAADELEDEGLREVILKEFGAAIAQAKDKRDRFAKFYRFIEKMVELETEEAERLSLRAATFKRCLESMKAYGTRALQAAGVRKVDGNHCSLWLQKGPDHVDVSDPAAVPSQYKTLTIRIPAAAWESAINQMRALDAAVVEQLIAAVKKTDVHVGLDQVRAALAAGEEVPGADLAFGQDGLRLSAKGKAKKGEVAVDE